MDVAIYDCSIETADLGGLDIFYNIASYLNEDLCDAKQPSALLKQAIDKGILGAKTGSGLYDWTPESLAKVKKTRKNILLEWLQKDQTQKLIIPLVILPIFLKHGSI